MTLRLSPCVHFELSQDASSFVSRSSRHGSLRSPVLLLLLTVLYNSAGINTLSTINIFVF